MTQIKVELEGFDAAIADLKSVGVDADKAILAAITNLVNDTRNEAIKGIQGGPKTGRIYRRGNVVHQASAAGQYPASDTGILASSVDMVLPSQESMTGKVGTNTVYGRYLEFGTSRMAARPWLLPSFIKAKALTLSKLKAIFEARRK